MLCPKCRGGKVKVLRTEKYEDDIYRVRRCEECSRVWNTRETIDEDSEKGGE